MTKAPTSRLDKLLSNMSYASRREIQLLARNGRILLDGVPVQRADMRIALTPDLETRLLVDGEALDPLPGFALMLNKPLGVTCSRKEAGPLVYDLLPPRWRWRDPAISTVGRLDKETSGLLLMTDDGALLHRIISPKHHVAKRYRVQLARPMAGGEAALFASGTLMLEGEDKPLAPAELVVISPQEAVLEVREGRYHQVRRMFAAAGNHVEALHRESIGALALPADLSPGEIRRLSDADLAAIFR
ncbi:16S rRNA pseudouridine(516) synthase [Fulvimarina sp. 2208YS6-2-32]|uniref:Pseudouridine synthase n=1 Tax=Fulvimarina uroteuthidis TaxID=3098149 RepID=A0ABU5I377_9HYPH|nr:16S rRNA pseudouridine(516) synthase [Fulvimarina sp. 2208YS6-2-32]MDY8109814.1 16S rRNA pseudouridine(516) synthase [Fulvimarina sp. 2208YS6-2-32]